MQLFIQADIVGHTEGNYTTSRPQMFLFQTGRLKFIKTGALLETQCSETIVKFHYFFLLSLQLITSLNCANGHLN